jgi:hypothetical protein
MEATLALIGGLALVKNSKMLAQFCRLSIKRLQFFAISCYNPADSQTRRQYYEKWRDNEWFQPQAYIRTKYARAAH